MVGATFVGTSIFPGAGTVAGMMFGIVGGVLSIFIPESTRHQITNTLQSGRESFLKFGFETRGTLSTSRAATIRIVGEAVRDNKAIPPMLKFSKTSKAENAIASIYFEKIYRLFMLRDLKLAQIKLAQKSKNTEAANRLSHEHEQHQQDLYDSLNGLESFYRNQFEYFEEKVIEADLARIDEQLFQKYPIVEDILVELGELKTVLTFVEFLSAEYQKSATSDDALKVMYRFYYYGFNRNQLLRIMNQ
jgi:hypothetical protein